MAVLTLKSDEIKTFPPLLREFASFKSAIENCSEKTVCEYLSDLRTFFRFMEAERLDIDKESDAFFEIDISKIDLPYISNINSADIYSFLLFIGYLKSALEEFDIWIISSKNSYE